MFVDVNGPGETWVDKESMILHTADEQLIDLNTCPKVEVFRTSGEWTLGWIIWKFSGINKFLILLDEESIYKGKVRTKTVGESYIRQPKKRKNNE